MRPNPAARPEYVGAFREIAVRIATTLTGVSPSVLPVKMYVAGGAALHFYTGERVSSDIDAVFSHRMALPENLEVTYRDVDGAARLLYFDRQYNATLSLMHEEDAQRDSLPLALPSIDSHRLDVRLLAPIDLAVSKLARFSAQDRSDILSLARHQDVHAAPLRLRAEEALAGYVGSVDRIRGSIEIACRILNDHDRDSAG